MYDLNKILNEKQLEDWNYISNLDIYNIVGKPNEKQMELLIDKKRIMKELLDGLNNEGKKIIKQEEAKLKKKNKVSSKNKITNDNEKKKKQREKQEEQRKKKEKERFLIQKRKSINENNFKSICEWFEIHYEIVDGEIELEVPKWVSDDEKFMDDFSLDYGKMIFEKEEFEELLISIGVKLAKRYFGLEFSETFEIENLNERANTASQIGDKIEGFPCWYECKTEPPLYEEIILSMRNYDLDLSGVEIETEKGMEEEEIEKDEKTMNTALSLLDSPLLNFN